MTILTQHAQGTFCWPELASTDQNGAKKFYGELFGWTATDVPMGPDAGFYTLFKKGTNDCAALYTLGPEMLKQGVPPNWGAYVAVNDAEESAKKAKELGGTVIMEPFDVMGTLGRMAVIQDPTGAVFSMWQAGDHIGASVLDEPGAMCWTELMTGDPDKARSFYTKLFGWTPMDMGEAYGGYTVFQRADGAKAGGLMKTPDEMAGVPPHWMTYFASSDIQQTNAQVQKLGGNVMVPPTPIPNIGTFAVYSDPQGAAFAVLQPQ
jgi:uncharacterized protein